MKNRLIRLTESDLHRIVKESVNKILNEYGNTPEGQFMLGRLGERNKKIYGDDRGVDQYALDKRNANDAKLSKERMELAYDNGGMNQYQYMDAIDRNYDRDIDHYGRQIKSSADYFKNQTDHKLKQKYRLR